MVEDASAVEFVTSAGNLWEVTRDEGEFQYYKNGIPQDEEQYNAALASSLPGSVTENPYDVVDEFSPDEIDRFAEEPDRLDDQEKKALKDVRAHHTYAHALQNVEAYNDILREVDSVDDVEDLFDLPIITSDDIRENQPQNEGVDSFRFKNYEARTDRPFESSGSTGVAKTFFKSYDETERIYRDAARGFGFFGVTDEDVVVNYWPTVGLNMSGYFGEGAMSVIGAETVPVHNTPLSVEENAELLRTYNPSVMLALPSHADSMGRSFHEEGIDPDEFGIEKILMAGEPISESRKERVEESFGAEVFEFFACSESGGVAFECQEGDGYHILEDTVHLGVIDEGDVQRTGRGPMVVTNLLHPGYESSMPLINDRLGDVVTLMEEGDCGCEIGGGRMMDDITREDWQFTLGGVNMDAKSVENIIYGDPEFSSRIDEYQLELTEDDESGKDRMDVLLEPEEGGLVGVSFQDVGLDQEPVNPADRIGQKILQSNKYLQDTVGTVVGGRGSAEINVEFVEDIDLGPKKPTRVIDKR